MANELKLDQTTAAMVALAEAGIPTDVQELLVRGDPDRGIAPGAITKALNTRPSALVEGLETVSTQFRMTDTPKRPWGNGPIPENLKGYAVSRELVTRSQAEAIIAEKDASINELFDENDRLTAALKETWHKHGGTEIALGQWKFAAKKAEADNADLKRRAEYAERELANSILKSKSLEADNATLTERVKELEDENAALEKQALRDRNLANETHSDATLWQFSVDMGDHQPLLVKVWKQRKALETQLAAARKALEWYANPEIYKPHPHGPAFDNRDVSYVARAALEDRP